MTKEEMKAILPKGTGEAAIERLLAQMNSEIEAGREALRAEYEEKIAKIERERSLERESALDRQMEELLKKRGARSTKAARAMIDMDAVRAAQDPQKALREAVDRLCKSEESAFLFLPQKTGRRVNVGGEALKRKERSGAEEAFRRAAGLK